MKSDEEIIELIIKKGIIGSNLKALISKNRKEINMLGVISRAVILGTFKANEKALAMNIPMVILENDNLYLVESGGRKKLIRKIDKTSHKLQKRFKLG